MSTKDVNLEISGDATGLVAALATARAAVLESTVAMRAAVSGVTETFKGLSEGFLALGAIMAGGAAFKEIITQTKEITSEAMKLGKSLGVSATEASTYNVAIEQVGGTTDDFADASRGLTRQLKTHEKALNDMGIATRDSNGHLKNAKDLMFDAIEAVNGYKEGTDRNLAAQTAFSRGASATSAIFRLNKEGMDEAARSAQELGLIVGTEDVQAYKENRKATAEVNDVFKGMSKAIGDALLPVLTQLAEWFRDIGPAAIGIMKGVIGGLVTSFWELILVGKVVGEIIGASFKTLNHTMQGLFDAIGLALHGNFADAGVALAGIATDVGTDWKVAFGHIVDDAKDTATKIKNLFADKTPTAASAPGKDFNLQSKEKEGPDNRLALMKNAYDQMAQANGDFDKKDIQANLQYWQSILANTVGNSKQDVKLRAEIEKEILSLKKKAHDEEIRAEEENIKTIEALQMGEVEVKRQALSQQLALGNITQRQEVQGAIQLENEKFRIQQEALQRRLALTKFDLLGQQKLKDDELKLEQKHALDVKKINDKAVLDERKTWDSLFSSMQSGFSSTISGFLKGTSSLGSTIKGLFTDITSSIISAIANMAAKWLVTSLMQVLQSKTSAVAIIGGLAAQAAAGAFAATAAIPYVGPALAPAAAATAYSETMAFSAVAIAAQGYDIPSNVNPVVQAHAKEMILPPEHAETIRALSRGGGGGGGGMTVNITATDARSLQKTLQQQGASGPLARAIRTLDKRFSR